MLPNALTLSQAVHLFLLFCRTKNLSPHTIEWYQGKLSPIIAFLGDVPVTTLETRHVRELLLCLPRRRGSHPREENTSPPEPHSPETMNAHLRALKALLNFLVEDGFLESSPAARVRQLRTTTGAGTALTAPELAALIQASRGAQFCQRRNHALILVLADTGIRVSELCRLNTTDLSWEQRSLSVLGKGSKIRVVPFGRGTARALAAYLSHRPDRAPNGAPLFVTDEGERLQKRRIQHILTAMGKRAGISGKAVSPHVLRRTFATLWIANGGDPFSLQRLLGHTTMEMVNRYVRLSTTDLQRTHAAAGPVDALAGARGRD
jgi:integrase/recombinase XerD